MGFQAALGVGIIFRLLMCFQAAYVCFGVILIREYAFRFTNGSLRVNRILRNVPWYGFLWGAIYFAGIVYELLTSRIALGFNFHSVILVCASVMVLNMLVQSWRAWRVLGRLNAAPVAAWRLVAVEANMEKNKNFVMAFFMGSKYGYDTRVLGKKLRVEIHAGSLRPWKWGLEPWQVQVNGQSLLLAVARDDGEAVVPLDGELNCLQGLSDVEREGLMGEIQRAVEAGVVEAA